MVLLFVLKRRILLNILEGLFILTKYECHKQSEIIHACARSVTFMEVDNYIVIISVI